MDPGRGAGNVEGRVVLRRVCMECGAMYEQDEHHGGTPVCSDLCRLFIKRRTRNRSEWLGKNPPPPGMCAVCHRTRLSSTNTGMCCRPCWSSMTREERDMWENRLGREAVRV